MSKIGFTDMWRQGKVRVVSITPQAADLISRDGHEWFFSPEADSYTEFFADELRQIADKLDELNRKDEHDHRDRYRERVESSLLEEK